MRHLQRHRTGEGQMTNMDGLCRSQVETAIHEWIIGKNAERDRAILARRLFDGICYEPLAEEFDMSVSQVKRIIQKGTSKIFSHL